MNRRELLKSAALLPLATFASPARSEYKGIEWVGEYFDYDRTYGLAIGLHGMGIQKRMAVRFPIDGEPTKSQIKEAKKVLVEWARGQI